jgi:hypothetical protein
LLAISQHEVSRCIKLFSPDGREQDCLMLDYIPAGMLVAENVLLVADLGGSSVRVYERTL